MSRWIRFLFAVLIGLSLGLVYGWVISPVEYVDTVPESLRQDYQTDYVLMVAEIFRADGDIATAVGRLSFLGERAPLDIVQHALQFANSAGYSSMDIETLTQLLDALVAWGGEAP